MQKTLPALAAVFLVVIAAEVSALGSSSYKTIRLSGSIIHSFTVALDGSGDYTDIQSAINAIPSSSKGIVLIRQGVFDLNPAIKYPYKSIVVRSNLTIVGQGIDKTIVRSFPTKQPYGSSIRAMSVTSTGNIQNLVLENLTIIQNGTPDNMGWSAIDLRGGTNTNIAIKNVKITDVTGAGIEIRRFDNVTVDNCTIERAFTGIALDGGNNGLIGGNRVVNTTGDGIFLQPMSTWNLSVTDVAIERNYIENTGDTGIDVTSLSGLPPHERINIEGNELINSHMRICYAHQVNVTDNILTNGYISVDNGQGRPINVFVSRNIITTSTKVGIGFYGAENSSAIGNEINLTKPAGAIIQVGISAGIWGTGVVEGNTIVGSANYGIDFGGWGTGGESRIVLRNNTILDFGNIGIYDDNVSDGPVLVENNTIWDRSSPFASYYGIRTDNVANAWIIRYNVVYAGSVAYISAPKSQVYGNTYKPPT